MAKYSQLNSSAKLALCDIFVILEEKFIQYAQVDDLIVVVPDLEKNRIICTIAKYENDIVTEFDKDMAEDLAPYFKKLKKDFTPEVVAQFIAHAWNSDTYQKDSSTIMTEHIIKKVQDRDYQAPKKKMP